MRLQKIDMMHSLMSPAQKKIALYFWCKPDQLTIDSALSLWFTYPVMIASRILYHRLFVWKITFLLNGQKKTSKSVVDLEALFQPFTIFPTMKHKIAGAIPIPNLIYGYVKNAISTLDIDLIHVHHPVMIGNVATRIGKEFHIPVVFTYHTRYEQYLHYLTPFGY